MRLLYAWLRGSHARSLQQDPGRQAAGDRGSTGRQHLPLRHLPADARCHRRALQDARKGSVTMANTWPKERRIIGTKVQRLDGPEKATGNAKYSYDINRPGMLHATILGCPYAHAKLKSLDTSAAEKMP